MTSPVNEFTVDATAAGRLGIAARILLCLVVMSAVVIAISFIAISSFSELKEALTVWWPMNLGRSKSQTN